MASHPILEIENLDTRFVTAQGEWKAIDQISFSVSPGETFCLVGESGSGKSVTSLAIMGLLQGTHTRINASVMRLGSTDLLKISPTEYRQIRGKRMAMIFQEPMTALNPVYTVGRQVAEVFEIHEGCSRQEANERALELFYKVKIADPKIRFWEYPHQLSGGMKQRVMIAMAIACRPEVLIADEPTTALDVTVQAQILHLLKELQQEVGTAILFISHDLGVVAQIADRLAIMYAGKIVEAGDVYSIFSQPHHPYTEALLAAIPQSGKPLKAIPGSVPSLAERTSGCPFYGRCAYAQDICRENFPAWRPGGETRSYFCHFTPQERSQKL